MSETARLFFAAPYQVVVSSESLPRPAPHELLVTSTHSAISAGTELLFYRGQVPRGMSADATIAGLDTDVVYPLAYGYASVGLVTDVGNAVADTWIGRRVFAFHPHASHFVADPSHLLPIPDNVDDEQAAFLPNMETAVNFVMDARPLIGEKVLIFGQGVVGLLTLRLLRRFPLAAITVVDAIPARRQLALAWGADAALSPAEATPAALEPDLVLELSSNPAGLRSAVDCARFGTRLVIGSWYGDKPVTLELGGPFHRNRVEIISSQVSSLDGRFSNRWNKARRLQVAWQHLQDLPVSDLVTHRLPLSAAPDAYRLLDQSPQEALQILFVYPS